MYASIVGFLNYEDRSSALWWAYPVTRRPLAGEAENLAPPQLPKRVVERSWGS